MRLGSERVSPADVDAFRPIFPSGVMLVIAYSSTEISTIAMHTVGPGEQFADGLVPVGAAVAGRASVESSMMRARRCRRDTLARSPFTGAICLLATGAIRS